MVHFNYYSAIQGYLKVSVCDNGSCFPMYAQLIEYSLVGELLCFELYLKNIEGELVKVPLVSDTATHVLVLGLGVLHLDLSRSQSLYLRLLSPVFTTVRIVGDPWKIKMGFCGSSGPLAALLGCMA